MFDIGILEIFIVTLIALLVLGPERLPKAAREAGRRFGQAKRVISHFSAEINRQIDNEVAATELKNASNLPEIDKKLQSMNNSIGKALEGVSLGNPEGEFKVNDMVNDKNTKSSKEASAA